MNKAIRSRSLCSALLILFAGISRAQMSEATVDSLRLELARSRSDTDSLRALTSLSGGPERATAMADARRALRLGDRCLARYPLHRRPILAYQCVVLQNLGVRSRLTGQVDSAIVHYTMGLSLAREIGDPLSEAIFLNGLGVAYYYQGKIEEAVVEMNKALQIQIAEGDSEQMALTYLNIGAMSHAQGNVPVALENYYSSIRIAEAIGSTQAIGGTLLNIGALFETQQELDSALATYRRAIPIIRSAGQMESLAMCYNNIATVHLTRHQPDSALEAVAAGLKVALEDHNPYTLSQLYFKMSRAHQELGALPEALVEARLSLAYADSAADVLGQVYGWERQAELLRLMGQPGAALAAALKAEDLGRDVDEFNHKKDIALLRAGIHEDLQDHRNALLQYRLYQELNDSLTNRENKKGLLRKSFEYEYDKKEALRVEEEKRKEAIAQAEVRRQELVRNGLLLVIVLVVAFASVFFLQRNRISREKQRSEELLHNILPEEVADEIKATGAAQAKQFDGATILFTDFKGFTGVSETMTAADLVDELHTCFKAFDNIITARGIEKIKTIGDAYMCAGGLPDPASSTPSAVVHAALEMQAFMIARKTERDARDRPAFEMRVGIHTGPVVAGIVGVKKFAYDIWGDTVNIASRMESSSEVGQVNISESTYALVKDEPGFAFTSRGRVQAKGKGEMEMYFVQRRMGS